MIYKKRVKIKVIYASYILYALGFITNKILELAIKNIQ